MQKELNQQMEVKSSQIKAKYTDDVAKLMEDVMEAKRQLEGSIILLNQTLALHGFELKPIDPK